MDDRCITSFKDICDVISIARTEIGTTDVWFRGEPEVGEPLVPKAYRGENARYEASRVNHFMLEAGTRRSDCPPFDERAKWLCLMSHYGLPTRLLDWTNSVLLAAYFAVGREDNRSDAIIWALSPGHLNIAEGVGACVWTMHDDPALPLIRAAFRDNPRSKPVHAVAVVPPQVDLRMLVQQSKYTIHGAPTPLSRHARKDEFLRRYRIKSEAKGEIRTALTNVGLNESTVFLDLQHLAAYLANQKYTAPEPPGPDATESPHTPDASQSEERVDTQDAADAVAET